MKAAELAVSQEGCWRKINYAHNPAGSCPSEALGVVGVIALPTAPPNDGPEGVLASSARTESLLLVVNWFPQA